MLSILIYLVICSLKDYLDVKSNLMVIIMTFVLLSEDIIIGTSVDCKQSFCNQIAKTSNIESTVVTFFYSAMNLSYKLSLTFSIYIQQWINYHYLAALGIIANLIYLFISKAIYINI